MGSLANHKILVIFKHIQLSNWFIYLILFSFSFFLFILFLGACFCCVSMLYLLVEAYRYLVL